MNGLAGNGFEERQVLSWNDFQQQIFWEKLKLNEFVWRGQRKAAWRLESVLRRLLRKQGVPQDNWARIVAKLEADFRGAARGRRGANPNTLASAVDSWSLGRHYGLATPLLDWTKSPFVAAYFAFVEEAPKKVQRDGRNDTGEDPEATHAIWAFRCSQEIRNKLKVIEPDTDENTRLISQAGLFTMVRNLIDDDLRIGCRRISQVKQSLS